MKDARYLEIGTWKGSYGVCGNFGCSLTHRGNELIT